MSPFVAFILGLLGGWLVEWIIDWVYWRRQRHEGYDRYMEASRARIQQLEAELAAVQASGPGPYQTGIAAGSARATAPGGLAEMPVTQHREAAAAQDDEPLIQHRGAAGAEMDEPLIQHRGAAGHPHPAERGIEFEEVFIPIEESKAEADRMEDIIYPESAPEQGETAEAAPPERDDARLAAIIYPDAAPPLPSAEMISEGGPVEDAVLPVAAPDDLEIIRGIGPVIARRLNDAGIMTFEQLGEETPAHLRELLGDVIQRLSDEDSIIRQAREFAARKHAQGNAA